MSAVEGCCQVGTPVQMKPLSAWLRADLVVVQVEHGAKQQMKLEREGGGTLVQRLLATLTLAISVHLSKDFIMFANNAFGLLVQAVPHITVAGGSVHPSQRRQVALIRLYRELRIGLSRLRIAWRRWLR